MRARIEELIAEALAAGAEADRLREASEAASARRAEAVAELNALGLSFRNIGKRIGVSAPRAGQLVKLGQPARGADDEEGTADDV